MEKLTFNELKKVHPDEAKEFFEEQEMLVMFLNSPNRERWLKAIGLSAEDIAKVNGVVEKYAQCKINEETEEKENTREQIILIENECLKQLFEGRILEVKAEKKAALDAAEAYIKGQFPNGVILNEKKLAKLSSEEGLSRKFPTDFLVFDAEGGKIISFGVVIEA